jgi:HSP20 family molecular chaperone IbpA
VGEELTIQIENQRNIFLPSFLARLNVKKANLEGGILKISFEKTSPQKNKIRQPVTWYSPERPYDL